MKYIIVLLCLCCSPAFAEDGSVGTSSVGVANISVEILPRVTVNTEPTNTNSQNTITLSDGSKISIDSNMTDFKIVQQSENVYLIVPE